MKANIVAVNVRGINSHKRLFAIKQWIKAAKTNLCLFTETKLSVNSNVKPEYFFGNIGYAQFSISNYTAAGTGFLMLHKSPFSAYKILYQDQHITFITLKNQLCSINVVVVYLYNKPAIINQVIDSINLILATNPYPTLLLGDFNMSYEDFNRKYLHRINKSLRSARSFFPMDSISYYTKHSSSLIDLLYYSPELHYLIKPSLIPITFSDHLALSVDLHLFFGEQNKMPLNRTTRMLTKSLATEAVLSEIYIAFNRINILDMDPLQAYFAFINILSLTVKSHSSYGIPPTKLMAKLEEINIKLASTGVGSNYIDSIINLKNQYKDIQVQLAEYISIKKAKIFLKETHSWSRGYLRWAVAHSGGKQVPSSLLHEDLVFSGDNMIPIVYNYFKEKLQKGSLTKLKPFYFGKSSGEHGIGILEIKNKLSSIPDSSHPGMHAIPKFLFKHLEFFTVPIINNMLKFLCKQVYTSDFLYQISMVPFIKKQIFPSPLSNLRPISMSPLIIKIMESLLKDKIQEFILPFISKWQFAKKGRSISEALFCFKMLIGYIRLNRKKAPIAVQLDIQAAYDSVPIYKLLEVISGYGIPSSYMYILANLLLNRKIHITLNGKISSEFVPYTSIPQGSPLSSLLFQAYIDPLLKSLEKSLPGVRIPELDVTLNHISFMDDVVVILPSRKYLPMLYNILNRYTECYKLVFNKEKNSIWQIFSGNKLNIPNNCLPHDVLGIPLHLSTNACRLMIQRRLIDAIGKILDSLSRAYLSLLSKVTLINMLIFPKLTYYLPIINYTSSFIRQINGMCSKLLWNRRVAVLSMKNLQKHSSLNGLSLHSLETFTFQRIYNLFFKICLAFPNFDVAMLVSPTDTPPPQPKNPFLLLLIRKIKPFLHADDNFQEKIKYWSAHCLMHNINSHNSMPGLLNITNKQLICKFKYWFLEPKYFDFLIKLNLEVLPTNSFLMNKLRFSSIEQHCSLCHRTEETVEHFLFHCSALIKYRELVKSMLKVENSVMQNLKEGIKTGFLPLIRISTFLLFTMWFVRCHFIFNPNSRKYLSLFTEKLEKIRKRDQSHAPSNIVNPTWDLISFQT